MTNPLQDVKLLTATLITALCLYVIIGTLSSTRVKITIPWISSRYQYCRFHALVPHQTTLSSPGDSSDDSSSHAYDPSIWDGDNHNINSHTDCFPCVSSLICCSHCGYLSDIASLFSYSTLQSQRSGADAQRGIDSDYDSELQLYGKSSTCIESVDWDRCVYLCYIPFFTCSHFRHWATNSVDWNWCVCSSLSWFALRLILDITYLSQLAGAFSSCFTFHPLIMDHLFFPIILNDT